MSGSPWANPPRRAERPVDHLNPVAMVSNLRDQAQLIRQFVGREIQQRYRGSALGVVWAFVTPVLMLLVYTFVFSVVLRVRWVGDGMPQRGEFALILFAGLVPFTVFSEVITRAPTLVLGQPNYVKKAVFPLETLPVAALGSALVHSLISAGILLAASGVLRGHLSSSLPLLPLAYVPLVLLTLGLGWFLASLGVYVRDVGQAIAIVTQLLFFVTPIVYPITSVPEDFRFLFNLNPLTLIVDGFRSSLLGLQSFPWVRWAGWSTVAAVTAVLGYAWFMNTKKGFATVM